MRVTQPYPLPARTLMGCVLVAWAVSCTTGEGDGRVESERLFVEGCSDGAFSLNPSFFGANPYGGDAITIRVQRSDDLVEVSDGLDVVVNGVSEIRDNQLGQAVAVGLPRGVTPLGVPVTPDNAPAPVSMALYLHETCHQQNGALYSLCGSITFTSLFSGNANERDSEDRLTQATFTAVFGDPRDIDYPLAPARYATSTLEGCSPDLLAGYPEERLSVVEGDFRFFFQRGPPAQPFP